MSAPKGQSVIWIRRLGNVGFGLALVYCIYLATTFAISARNNASFEGQILEPVGIENFDAAMGEPGKKVVVLWATWCGPCHSLLLDLKEEASLGHLKLEQIITVSVSEPAEDVRVYLEKYPLPFRVGTDPSGILARRLKLAGTPTVLFLNEGRVIHSVSTGGFGLARRAVRFLN